MVRNGDLNYKTAFHNSSMVSNGVPLQGGTPLRQAKISVIVFCSKTFRTHRLLACKCFPVRQ